MNSSEAPWLDDREQHLWRTWLRVNALMTAALHRELQLHSRLSLPDFEVLVHLTDASDDRLRVSDLGRNLQWEKSRLSHHLRRMTARGLVERTDCTEDARVSYIAATDEGRAAIRTAAPSHVEAVRRFIFDGMGEPDLETVDAFLTTVLSRLEQVPVDPCV